jgi:hypothetical protein
MFWVVASPLKVRRKVFREIWGELKELHETVIQTIVSGFALAAEELELRHEVPIRLLVFVS